ncbi:conserved hypothetical protein [Candidatus Methylobacter favarea]|uniref:Glycosyltransferase family 4 protein n=1 Tax=Candidatus Methylobacter favarea TaxID=2707345 RepID=A0A8S0XH05_9GAMM|nr:glycosyltransferase [Candidatus Methylobacter favarea]CAA9889321.1 conserved hypothetical protein [Candidatus Methylobacter favarea]
MHATTKEIISERPIRVLEIIGNGIIGGMEMYVLRLISGLPRSHFTVICICPYESRFTRQLREAGCEVFITPIHEDPLWQSIQFTTQLINFKAIDVVHAHLPNAHVLAGLCSQLSQVPGMATVHGMFVPSIEVEISQLTGTHLTVVSQSAYMQALTIGIPAERLSLIANGVDTKIFSPRPRNAEFRALHNIPETALLVGFVGRLAVEKGPDRFARAAELIHKTLPDTHFLMVGEGPMEDEIRQIISQSNLEDCIHMTGILEDMQNIYPEFDILVSSSRSEGMPLVVLEAMASGIPIVAMDVGGVAEIIESAMSGFLAKTGDIEALAHFAITLLATPELKDSMGQAARQRVERQFSLSASVDSVAQLICGLKNNYGVAGRGSVSSLLTRSSSRKKGVSL